jgi:SagB-type dehydrogenase family enzyme
MITGIFWGVNSMANQNRYALPPPQLEGGKSLTEALRERRSVRSYAAAELSLAEVAQLLWAAQGITSADARRTAPSAGALYPLELYLVAGAVSGFPPGVYHYEAAQHRLVLVASGDPREATAAAAYGQEWIAEAAAAVVIAAVPERTTRKYGGRGIRYVHMEVGHAGQNLLLQAAALGLASVVVGAFDDAALGAALALPQAVQPLAILPVGHPR